MMALPLVAVLAIGAGVGAAGQLPQFLGSIEEARSLREMASYQKDVAEVNATTLRYEALAERYRRESEEAAERDISRRRLAIMEASYARSGVMVSGTPARFMERQAGMDERATLQRSEDSTYRRRLLRRQAQNVKIEARNVSSAMRAQAKSVMFQAVLGMGKSTVAGAVGGAAGASGGISSLLGMGGGSAGGAGGAAAGGGGFSWMDAIQGQQFAGSLLGGSR